MSLTGSSVEQIITALLGQELPEHGLEGCHLPSGDRAAQGL